MNSHENNPLKDQSIQLRRKYHALKERACNLDERDQALKEMRDLLIYEARYEFDPETFMTDRLIPKGGILKAIQDCT